MLYYSVTLTFVALAMLSVIVILSLDVSTAEHFAATFNQLKCKVTMMFITHAMPKNLQVDDVVKIGFG
jgi:ABC-type transport system involved in cytochrome bd biosynthesis fused ATPase/permease subunit